MVLKQILTGKRNRLRMPIRVTVARGLGMPSRAWGYVLRTLFITTLTALWLWCFSWSLIAFGLLGDGFMVMSGIVICVFMLIWGAGIYLMGLVEHYVPARIRARAMTVEDDVWELDQELKRITTTHKGFGENPAAIRNEPHYETIDGNWKCVICSKTTSTIWVNRLIRRGSELGGGSERRKIGIHLECAESEKGREHFRLMGNIGLTPEYADSK